MKIKIGIPKVDNKKHIKLLENGWNPLKEPKSVGRAILLSIPLMIFNAFITVGVIEIFSSISLKEFGIDPTSDSLSISINLVGIVSLFLLIVIHELLHLVFIPNFIESKKTFIGFTLFGGYVLTEEVMSRSRYLLITISPFVIISIFLPILFSLLGILTPAFKIIILVNAMASSVDILNLILLFVQVPKGAKLISNGSKTYWKEEINHQQ
ncbi:MULTISPECIES: DUF3267 domain-containing protein [unclassified Virgibacillus]|uniref:DUF3267 domain-containing protein n=1 Tax=unclassified Virgibacillus TaxID=2620237 RepID=UPI0024DDFB46|nr:DUF3267 domain-containing protein [Virgibacillus sp. LDC-1]